jgi:hypothetical protein
MISFIFKKKINIYRLDKEGWETFLKTESFIDQKNLMYMFLKKFENIYKDVNNYHNKKKEQLMSKCSEDIVELI